MKSKNTNNWWKRFAKSPDLETASNGLNADSHPYQRAKAELEKELGELDQKSKDLDKQLVITMTKLKQVDSLYKKVGNGEALNELEANQLELIRL